MLAFDISDLGLEVDFHLLFLGEGESLKVLMTLDVPGYLLILLIYSIDFIV